MLAGAPAVAAHGQPAAASRAAAVRSLTGVGEDRVRDAQLFTAEAAGHLLRATSAGVADSSPRGASVLTPTLRLTHNSALPYALNDGAVWAGRGAAGLLRVGVSAHVGRVRVVLAPELALAANRPFDFLPLAAPGRSAFASPFHSVGRATLDMPSRFGDGRYARIGLGQSALVVRAGAAEFGASTEHSWWGPGRWNALVLAPNAEGFPHLFARTAHPIGTRIGDIEARAIVGGLSPSLYLDAARFDSQRAFSGVALTLRPAGLRDLTVGLTRTVVASTDRDLQVLGHALDALTVWQSTPTDTARGPRGDQLTGAFARWIFPEEHVEVYGEWARAGAPRSLRELVVAPEDGRAFTIGARALRPLGARATADGRYLRVELELTTTEQTATFRDRPRPASLYTGRATREGYTHRGQLLGAAIGPGGSSQFAAIDHVTRRTSAGLVLGRIRWDNDALYERPGTTFFRHDVSTLAGARGSYRTRVVDIGGEATWARRYNYLFQNGFSNPGGRRTVDVTNVTLTLSLEPR